MDTLKAKVALFLFTLLFFFTNSIAPVLATTRYTYDASGNMTSDGTNCYTYNDANQLSQVKNCNTNQVVAAYVYDYQGNRLEKKIYTNGTLTKTVYSPDKSFETVKLASNGATLNTSYYYVNDELVARKNPDGSKNYYHSDNLHSTSVLTDQSGNVVENTTYYPYGQIRSGGTQSKYLYTGQENDPETGLDYYNARYYSPHIQRFTQPDTEIADVYNPQNLNRYSYVRNNPLTYTDPTGHWLVPALIIGAGALLEAYQAVSSYSLENPHATLQQKTEVGLGGLAIGALSTAATLYAATSLPAMAIVGGVSFSLEKMNENVVSGKPYLDKSVITQGVAAGFETFVTAGLVKGLNLVPNNVGRPIELNSDRPFLSSFTKNSLNRINQETVPGVLNSLFGVIDSSVSTIYKNNNMQVERHHKNGNIINK